MSFCLHGRVREDSRFFSFVTGEWLSDSGASGHSELVSRDRISLVRSEAVAGAVRIGGRPEPAGSQWQFETLERSSGCGSPGTVFMLLCSVQSVTLAVYCSSFFLGFRRLAYFSCLKLLHIMFPLS